MTDAFSHIRLLKLGEVALLFSGIPITPKHYDEDGKLFIIGLKDTDVKFNIYPNTFGRSNMAVKEDKLLQSGDVLLKSRSHDFQAITVAQEYNPTDIEQPVIAGPGFIVARPNDTSSLIQSDYLAWIINRMSGELSKYISGTAIKQISMKALTNLEIPVPPIESQKKIMATQNEITAARALADAYFTNIEELLVGKLKSAVKAESN